MRLFLFIPKSLSPVAHGPITLQPRRARERATPPPIPPVPPVTRATCAMPREAETCEEFLCFFDKKIYLVTAIPARKVDPKALMTDQHGWP